MKIIKINILMKIMNFYKNKMLVNYYYNFILKSFYKFKFIHKMQIKL